MKQHKKFPNRRENLEAENALLKLKLELEHSMIGFETGDLPPGVENQWLNSIYRFEQEFKDAKPISIFDKLGRPDFKKYEDLHPNEVATALDRLYQRMADHHIVLDCICEYDDSVIYKFITEEFFYMKVDDMNMPGMSLCFTYEEFHMNHDYEIRRITKDIVNSIFRGQWSSFDALSLYGEILAGAEIKNKERLCEEIQRFQQSNSSLKLDEFLITGLDIDESNCRASLNAQISFTAQSQNGERNVHNGQCSFAYVLDSPYWEIRSILIPGIL